jgi:hypothetical protein
MCDLVQESNGSFGDAAEVRLRTRYFGLQLFEHPSQDALTGNFADCCLDRL